MLRIVADVGGTNTRLALVDPKTGRPGPSTAFRNDDFPGFSSVVARFVDAHGGGAVAEICLAIAGPVTGDTARLTNRDWSFDTRHLARHFGASRVVLMNDLTALGLALQYLDDGALDVIAAGQGPGNGQRLVVNIGTGFNVSLVLGSGRATICALSEAGHVSLPGAVRDALEDLVPGGAGLFPTVEELFSGRGLARFLTLAPEAAGAPPALHYTRLVARLARDLALAYMPLSGLVFAGGVARSVLAPPARSAFTEVFRAPFPVAGDLARVPVAMIVDDAAGLWGCAHSLASGRRPLD